MEWIWGLACCTLSRLTMETRMMTTKISKPTIFQRLRPSWARAEMARVSGPAGKGAPPWMVSFSAAGGLGSERVALSVAPGWASAISTETTCSGRTGATSL